MAAQMIARVRTCTIEGRFYRVHEGPDRGQRLIERDHQHWAFARRDEEGNWIANTVHGWVDPALVARIMGEAT